MTHATLAALAYWARMDATVGARLRALRQQQRLTQAAVAAATGIDRSHLSVVENHGGGLTLDNVRALARLYGVSLEWLVEGRGPMHLDPRAAEILAALDALPDEERETYLRIIFARQTTRPPAAARTSPASPRKGRIALT
jgi:transcriptional regulator with XRE-family HTH domain